jgi:capsular exopolysaccharide synthesis family protein
VSSDFVEIRDSRLGGLSDLADDKVSAELHFISHWLFRMNTNERLTSDLDSTANGPNLLGEAVRFLQVIRRKLPTLLVCTILGGIIGTAWYVTATRKYESISEIMVLKTDGNVLDTTNQSNQRSIQDIMPTYQKVLTSDRVLEGAITRLPNAHRIDLKGTPKSRWTAVLKKNLTVSSTRLTNMIQVRYVSKNAKTAKLVVDAIVAAYLEYMNEIHKGNSKESMVLLNREKAQSELAIRNKETDLLGLKRDSGILLHGNDKNSHVIIEQTVKLNDALIEAQKKTLESRALLISVQHALAEGNDIQPYLQQAAGDISREFLLQELGVGANDAYSVAKHQDELLQDQAELQNRLMTLGPKHPTIRQLEDRIQQTQKWLSERRHVVSSAMKDVRERELGPKLLEMVKQRLYQAGAHEQAIREDFEIIRSQALSLNGQMAQIDIVEMDLKRMRLYYDLILEQMKKIDIGADSGLKISVPTVAKVVPSAVAPKISTTVFLCTLFGLVSGMAIIYVIDVLDDRFRSPDELQTQLGLPMLAMIREMEVLDGSGLDAIVTYAKPDSLEAESFRTLRSSITFSTSNTQRLVMTSTEPGDGKTTTLANLSVAFAQAKKKTLLIDADLRRPGMTQLLELKGPRGLSQILRETTPVAECCLENIFNLGIENLDVMPSGSRPANPSELLASDRFNDILAWAESAYDQILIDAPPVLAVTDPAIIGRLVDGAVVVIRPDKNRRKLVLRAVESFRMSGVEVIGIVANHIGSKSNSEYGYGYGYSYGYGHDDRSETTTEATDDEYEVKAPMAA